MRNRVAAVKLLVALLTVLILAACGSKGGGGGGAPAEIPDVAGTWTVHEVIDNTGCGKPNATDDYSITVQQDGASLTVITPNGTFTGSVSGDQVSWTGQYADSSIGGFVTITALSVTVSGNSLSGTAHWEFRTTADGSVVCSGTTVVTGTRTSGGGGGGGGGTPKFTGFDFSLSAGTYWDFYWAYTHLSLVQGSDPTTDVDSGNFRITLGQPASMGGVTAYPVTASGKTTDRGGHNYFPQWQYLAVNNNQILGSVDGAAFKVIFDANTGEWQGGGLFTKFSDTIRLTATSGTINNEFTKTSAVSVGRSAGQTQCETIGDITVCPNDTAYDLSEREYYKGGIGPLGYYFRLGWTSSGGGFTTSFTYERNLGLVATSLSATDGFIPKRPPWTKKKDMPTPRSDHSAVALNGKIYVMGGSESAAFVPVNTVVIYDPSSDMWTTGTPMPDGRSGHVSAVVNGKIYVTGGHGNSTGTGSTVWEYDPVQNIWSRKALMPQVASQHAGAEAGGFIAVFPDSSQSAYAYEVSGNTWYNVTNIPASAHGRTASSVGGKVYLIGGLSSNVFQNTCLELQMISGGTDIWTSKNPMPTGRRSLTSSVVNGKIYAIGGFNYNGRQRTVEAYDPITNSWSTKYAMSEARDKMASAVVNGKIYVIGGWKDNVPVATPVATVEEYDPASDN
jgi:N-acetylneuraminic acid mutarotase